MADLIRVKHAAFPGWPYVLVAEAEFDSNTMERLDPPAPPEPPPPPGVYDAAKLHQMGPEQPKGGISGFERIPGRHQGLVDVRIPRKSGVPKY